MNTTSGKVRLATYDEMKTMITNNTDGKIVWSGSFNTTNIKTHTLTITSDYDYVSIRGVEYTDQVIKLVDGGSGYVKVGSLKSGVSVPFTLSGKTLSAKISYVSGDETYLKVNCLAYKYD